MDCSPIPKNKYFQSLPFTASPARYQSPSVLKVREIVTRAELKAKLSGFDLIVWNQRSNYNPNELQKRLKFQNDVMMSHISNEKTTRHKRPLFAKRILPNRDSSSKLSYSQHHSLIKEGQNTKFLTESQEDLIQINNTPPATEIFKMKHERLWNYYASKASRQGSTEDKVVLDKRCVTEPLKTTGSPLKRFHIKKKQEGYMKTRKEEINIKMERVLKHWKRTKNSINERYFDIWIKPFCEKKTKDSLLARFNTEAKSPTDDEFDQSSLLVSTFTDGVQQE